MVLVAARRSRSDPVDRRDRRHRERRRERSGGDRGVAAHRDHLPDRRNDRVLHRQWRRRPWPDVSAADRTVPAGRARVPQVEGRPSEVARLLVVAGDVVDVRACERIRSAVADPDRVVVEPASKTMDSRRARALSTITASVLAPPSGGTTQFELGVIAPHLLGRGGAACGLAQCVRELAHVDPPRRHERTHMARRRGHDQRLRPRPETRRARSPQRSRSRSCWSTSYVAPASSSAFVRSVTDTASPPRRQHGHHRRPHITIGALAGSWRSSWSVARSDSIP